MRRAPLPTAHLKASRLLAAGACLGFTLALTACGNSPDATLTQAKEGMRSVAGVPQNGITLGSPAAAATLTVYADITSLEFGRFVSETLPQIVRRYVRPGHLNILLRTVAPSAGDTGVAIHGSALGGKTAQAAGLQNRLWQFVAVLAARNPGYIDDVQLTEMVELVAGLDPEAVRQQARSRRVQLAVTRAGTKAAKAGVTTTPAFVLENIYGTAKKLPWPATTPVFLRALNSTLAVQP